MTSFSGFNMSNPIEVPDIEQLDKWDQLHQQAIDSLEISADGFVKCQKCGLAVRMAAKGLGLTRSNGDKINLIEQRIKHTEYLHSKNIIPIRDYDSSIREMNEELATLLKREEIKDKLRRLPLYSSRITQFKFLCSSCYDKAYKRRARQKL